MLSITRKTILVVDDEPAILGLVNTILTFSGYRVLVANGPIEAIDIFRRTGAVDLLLSDVIMPEVSGPELAKLITQGRPEVAVLFMSGYAEDEIVHRGMVDPGVTLLSKPFGPDSLARAVRKQLDDHSFSERKSS